MAKKKKRHAAGGMAKGSKEERGFTVVFAGTRKRAYLSSHPEGVSHSDAESLSAGLAADTEVVPVSDVS